MEKIKYFFSVGSINYNQKTKSFLFIVSSSKDLSLIIDHLNLFPLITQKRADYELWKQAFELIERGENLTFEGLSKIISIKASMNRGLSEKLKEFFPNIIPAIRPEIKYTNIQDTNWIRGFA